MVEAGILSDRERRRVRIDEVLTPPLHTRAGMLTHGTQGQFDEQG